MRIYGFYAVLMGLTAPFIWTFKAFYIRLSLHNKLWPIFDLSIDQMFYYGIASSVLFFIYIAQNPFEWNVFIEGCLTGFFFLMGTIFTMVAYDKGPGGPVNALICTQIIY